MFGVELRCVLRWHPVAAAAPSSDTDRGKVERPSWPRRLPVRRFVASCRTTGCLGGDKTGVGGRQLVPRQPDVGSSDRRGGVGSVHTTACWRQILIKTHKSRFFISAEFTQRLRGSNITLQGCAVVMKIISSVMIVILLLLLLLFFCFF